MAVRTHVYRDSYGVRVAMSRVDSQGRTQGGSVDIHKDFYKFGTREPGPSVKINWSAIGAVNVEEAREFALMLADAIATAVKIEAGDLPEATPR